MTNNHLTDLQQLMVITGEECGELVQVSAKMMRKYTQPDQISKESKQKLIEEAGDVLCMIQLLVSHNLLTDEELQTRVLEKQNKLKVWSNLIK